MSKGKVFIVGAGPGDPELLSIKAYKIIENADVIIYDRLVSNLILQQIPEKIEKIFGGKKPSDHHLSQNHINKIIVEEARKGKIVVRLKGGDPLLFGRGGEEALMLRKAGIEFEIIPGISSALAVPTYAGIPLTHRGYSSSLTIITGHEDPTKSRNFVNWEKIGTITDTIVVLMGISRLKKIVKYLLKAGKHSKTPIAIIEHGTTTHQREIIGDLSNIIQKIEEYDVQAPAVIVIGDVVKLQKDIQWFKR
jgi:uroporphyrin-III C-methyltransferase